LDHPNVVPLLGTTCDPYQLISVWMAGGELSAYIGAHPCANRLGLVSDVADGLNYLHSLGVIHGDLKGPSVLVDGEGRARITDFSFSTVFADFGSDGSIKEGHGARWAAPEILDERTPVSKSSDVYSFAMVTIEIFTGKAPFYGIAPATAAVGVLAGERPARPRHPDLTDDLWEIMERCWHQEPRYRLDIAEVILYLRSDADPECDRTYAHDDQTADETYLESFQWERSLIRLCRPPPRWTPTPCVLRRCFTFVRFSTPSFASGMENPRYTGLESEKPAAMRRQPPGASGLPRTGRSWFSGFHPFKRSQSNDKRGEIEVDTTHDGLPVSKRSLSHSIPFKIIWKRVCGHGFAISLHSRRSEP
jgi:serine/threonine protein kinase